MAADETAQPIHRVAVRLLPVSPEGRVLLLQGQDPAHPGDLHWVSVGGAVDPGETHEEAAVRELHEETGIDREVADLVGPIGTGVHPFSWAGTDYVSHSTFYAIPVAADATVHFEGLEPGEVGNILQAAWWTPAELEADGTAASDDMPAMMATAIDAVLGGTL
ncbi:NUDIX hydrolase [Nocardioides stalactiti]|uniref:NUDIX hydrolase n=1 Tax=Nocardioides stalactiti TaxID=2755356 RepID=UPI00160389AE|nr:NUDIX domain-containing protein [Nocardioides stalactiti]